MKKLISLFVCSSLALGVIPCIAVADTISITKQGGDNETAYVEWTGSANDYDVYVKKAAESDSSYVRLDEELTRTYRDHYRADALGLAAGSYIIKIEASDGTTAETNAIDVTAHRREGFAFSKNSPNKTASGGYNNDGTVPQNAQIIYITQDNLETVKLDVYTSSTKITSCVGLDSIIQARGKGYDNRPLIIRIIGTIDTEALGWTPGKYTYAFNSNGYIDIKQLSNVTVEGVGNDATLDSIGIHIKYSDNIEVRNLGVMMYYDDGISIEDDNNNIWVHDNDLFYGRVGSDADQVKGDGAIDSKRSEYITISYNHFFDNGKCNLLDSSATNDETQQSNYMTYHHNWYDHSDSRHPRIRHATTHTYNNYFDGNAKYGVGATSGASVFSEANVFRNCKYPMLISNQGNEGGNSLSKEAGGIIKVYNNQITDGTITYYQEDNTEFDAYLASSRDEQVPSGVKTKVNTKSSMTFNNTYNNFDTDANIMYKYTPDDPSQVAAIVERYAGRIEGGDFKWEFNDEVDDEKYAVNNELREAILAYENTELVKVGIGGTPIATAPPAQTAAPTQPADSTPTPTAVPTEAATSAPLTGDVWKITKDQTPISAGAQLMDGLTIDYAIDSASNGESTIAGVDFPCYFRIDSPVPSFENGKIINGFKYEADRNGTLTLYVSRVHKDKPLVIVKEGEINYEQNIDGVCAYYKPANSNDSYALSLKVNAGSTYYMASIGSSSTRYAGVVFTPESNSTDVPTATPTMIPTATPTMIPTEKPTAEPSAAPTAAPTAAPSETTPPDFAIDANGTDVRITLPDNLPANAMLLVEVEDSNGVTLAMYIPTINGTTADVSEIPDNAVVVKAYLWDKDTIKPLDEYVTDSEL